MTTASSGFRKPAANNLGEAFAVAYPDVPWEGHEWQLGQGDYPGVGKTALRWNIANVPRSHPSHAHFQRVGRRLFATLLVAPPDGFGPYSASTVENLHKAWKTLVRWLISEDFSRLRQVSAEDTLTFLEWLAENGFRDKPRTKKNIRTYYLLLKVVSATSPEIGDVLSDVAELSKVRALGADPQTRARVPEAAVLALIRHARDVVEVFGKEAVALRRQFVEQDRAYNAEWSQTRTGQFNERARLTPELAALVELAKLRPLASSCHSFLARHLAMAGAVVIWFMAGLRSGEPMRLRHKCLVSVTTTNGVETALHGTLSKTKREHDWVACKPVVAAVRILQELRVAETASDADAPLFAVGRTRYRKESWRSAVLDQSLIAARLREFAALAMSRFDIDPTLVDSLTPTDGRRYFAQFVSVRNKTGLRELAFHYGHVSDLLTENCYAGARIDFADELDEALIRDLAESLDDLVNSTEVFDPAGKESELPRLKAKFLLAKNADVGDLLDSGVVLAPCDWGYCLYRQAFSRCKGTVANPNPANRSPSVCAGCKNFKATARHAPWWEMRRDYSRQFLRASRARSQARTLVIARIAECEEVLRNIGAFKPSLKP